MQPALILRRAPGVAVERDWGRAVASLAVPLVLGMGMALPLVWLLGSSFDVAAINQPTTWGLDNWVRAFGEPRTLQALWNSLALGLVRTLLALPLAIGMAWLITRTDMPYRSLLEAIIWLGVFTPTLPLVEGWILLLDPHFGLINTAWQSFPFASGPLFDLYSFAGITWVHVTGHAVLFMVILLLPGFRRLSSGLEEAAWMSGAGQLRALARVTVPLLAPAVLAAAFLSFIRSLEAFEVELLLGRPVGLFVYSTRIYDFVKQEPPRLGEATALGSVFLVVMLVLAVLYQAHLRGRQFTTVTGSAFATRPLRLGGWRWLATGICSAYLAIGLAAPLIFLVTGSFMRRYGFFQIRDPFTLAHWQAVFQDSIFLPSVWNSLLIATATAVLVVLIYSLVAYVVVRSRLASAGVVDLLAWLPWGTPGILLSLGLLWLFLTTPLRSLLYGTLGGIVVALLLKESPSSTQLFKAAYHQISGDLEEAARVSGAAWPTVYLRVLLPLLAPTAATIWLLAFASSLRDISTSVLLYSPQSRPLSILMLEYSFSGELERGSAVGILITVLVMALMLASRWWTHRASALR